MPLRVGIVGASRRRQGIGQHVARHLADLGAEVVAIAGSRRETAQQAAAHLADRYALCVRPHASLAAMLAGEALDAVAICSPDAFHRQHLLEALAAGAHVLCEKPLVFDDGRDGVADAQAIVQGFADAGRVLMVNEQWPFTLPAYERLHPDARLRERWPREFSMLLSPDAAGPEMIPNSLPHALSLLLAVMPPDGDAQGVEAEDIEVEFSELDGLPGAAAEVRFCCRHAQGHTGVAVTMRRAAEAPRPAGYAIDGRWAYRRIEMPEYRLWLEAEPQQASDVRLSTSGEGLLADGHAGLTARRSPACTPLEDPLKSLLADFVNRCEQARTTADVYKDATILTRLAMLRDVHRVACGQLEGAR